MVLGVLIPAVVLAALVSTLAGALAARAAGVGVPRVDLGILGPRLRVAAGASSLTISPWLVGGSCTLKDVSNIEAYPGAPGNPFSAYGRFARAALVLAGPGAVFLAAALLAGGDAAPALRSAFAQVATGALDPLGAAQAYLAAFQAVAAQDPAAALGIALAKFTAVLLLPVPPLNGGHALVELLRPRAAPYGRGAAQALAIGGLFVLAIAASWLVALGAWLLRSGAA